MGEMAAGLVHEIRNPLTVMKNSLYSLGEVLSHKEKAKRHLDLIDTQLDEASYIVKELLDFTREIKPELSFINVNDVVEASLRSRQIPGRVKVVKNLSRNLPQIVEANGGRIEVNSKKGEGSTFYLRFPVISKDR